MTKEKFELIKKQVEQGYADMSIWDKEDRIAELKRLINCIDVSKERKEMYKEMLRKELD